MNVLLRRYVLLTSVLLLPISLAQTALPPCAYEDFASPHTSYDDWPKTLLDTLYKLPADYAPADLVSVSEAGLAGDYKVRELLIADLRALVADAPGAGLELQSAYRSYSYQENTFNYWVEQEGQAAALKTSARAGHSEHQLGTTLDFKTKGGIAPWELDDWATTPEGAWLAANAWRYGFIMSYPQGKEALSCYSYEPWHYRYIGRTAAAELQKTELTLREWLWLQQ